MPINTQTNQNREKSPDECKARNTKRFSPVFEGDVREDHAEQCHRGVDDRHAQGEGPGDDLANRYPQVNGGRVMLQGAAA